MGGLVVVVGSVGPGCVGEVVGVGVRTPDGATRFDCALVDLARHAPG
ncbi:hypothetical protein ACWES4_36500 [Streptomyces sp. NPDC004011]